VSTLGLVLLMGMFVLLQGFFSGSEIALVSADRFKLQSDAERRRRGAALAMRMLERPTHALGTCLIGTNVSVIATATIGVALLNRYLDLPAAVAAVVVVPLTLTLGEMVPKAVYQHHADRLVGILAFPLRGAAMLFWPVLVVLDGLTRLVGSPHEPGPTVTRQELRLLLERSRSEGLTPANQALIRRVFAFTEAVVEDSMVPLIEVVAVPTSATLDEAARRITESGHSRLPVYQDRIDRIVGVVLHQDLLAADDWTAPVTVIARPAIFVPESKRVDDLLLEMQRERQRLAVAVDEYGGAVGIITVEDLLEEIVGEIEDESDRKHSLVRRTGEREWLASGRAEREHIEQACGLVIPDGDFETVAGYVLAALGRVPRVGEYVNVSDFVVTVSRANDRAIIEVTIRRAR